MRVLTWYMVDVWIWCGHICVCVILDGEELTVLKVSALNNLFSFLLIYARGMIPRKCVSNQRYILTIWFGISVQVSSRTRSFADPHIVYECIGGTLVPIQF